MTTSQEVVLHSAELAQASYATLVSGASGTTLADLLREPASSGGFSATQAVEFAAQYSVVTQYNDADTSFSATVFKDGSGNLTLAIRGTLEGEIGDRPRFYSHDQTSQSERSPSRAGFNPPHPAQSERPRRYQQRWRVETRPACGACAGN